MNRKEYPKAYPPNFGEDQVYFLCPCQKCGQKSWVAVIERESLCPYCGADVVASLTASEPGPGQIVLTNLVTSKSILLDATAIAKVEGPRAEDGASFIYADEYVGWVRESPARITELARAVWPTFSCPGCVDPLVVIRNTSGDQIRLERITRIGQWPDGVTHIEGVKAGEQGSCGIDTDASAAAIIAACAEAGVPCVEVTSAVPSITLRDYMTGKEKTFIDISCLEPSEFGGNAYVGGANRSGKFVGLHTRETIAGIQTLCDGAGVPRPLVRLDEEPEYVVAWDPAGDGDKFVRMLRKELESGGFMIADVREVFGLSALATGLELEFGEEGAYTEQDTEEFKPKPIRIDLCLLAKIVLHDPHHAPFTFTLDQLICEPTEREGARLVHVALRHRGGRLEVHKAIEPLDLVERLIAEARGQSQ